MITHLRAVKLYPTKSADRHHARAQNFCWPGMSFNEGQMRPAMLTRSAIVSVLSWCLSSRGVLNAFLILNQIIINLHLTLKLIGVLRFWDFERTKSLFDY